MGLENELINSMFHLGLFCFEVTSNLTKTNLKEDKELLTYFWV